MRRDARTDRNQAEIVKALKDHGASVTLLHRVGGGCPDLLIAAHGQWGLIEVKDGKKPPSEREKTKAQIKWWDRNVNGGARAIVTDVDGALRFLLMLRFPHTLPEPGRQIKAEAPSLLPAQ